MSASAPLLRRWTPAEPHTFATSSPLLLRCGDDLDLRARVDRRRRHRRPDDGPHVPPDRRAGAGARIGPRSATPRRRHQPPAQCGSGTVRPGPGRRTTGDRDRDSGMGPGGSQRQRHLGRAPRSARRLQLAAVLGPPRATADAAVPNSCGAARPGRGDNRLPGAWLPEPRRTGSASTSTGEELEPTASPVGC